MGVTTSTTAIHFQEGNTLQNSGEYRSISSNSHRRLSKSQRSIPKKEKWIKRMNKWVGEKRTRRGRGRKTSPSSSPMKIDADANPSPSTETRISSRSSLSEPRNILPELVNVDRSASASWKIKLLDISGHTDRICYTPNSDDLKEKFNKYCPLCMCYFRNILQTTCCSHYICYGCALSYEDSAVRLPESIKSNLVCPHCTRSGFNFTVVDKDALQVRNYGDDIMADPADSDRRDGDETLITARIVVGDCFDELRSKMIRFDSFHSQKKIATSGGGGGVDNDDDDDDDDNDDDDDYDDDHDDDDETDSDLHSTSSDFCSSMMKMEDDISFMSISNEFEHSFAEEFVEKLFCRPVKV